MATTVCPECRDLGWKRNSPPCEVCGGTGRVKDYSYAAYQEFKRLRDHGTTPDAGAIEMETDKLANRVKPIYDATPASGPSPTTPTPQKQGEEYHKDCAEHWHCPPAPTEPQPDFQESVRGLCQSLWDSAVEATREGFRRDAEVYPADTAAEQRGKAEGAREELASAEYAFNHIVGGTMTVKVPDSSVVGGISTTFLDNSGGLWPSTFAEYFSWRLAQLEQPTPDKREETDV